MSLMKRWAKQLFEGIKYLNDMGYGHLDIKPSNLLIDKDTNLKICDLGLACKPSNIEGLQECQTVFYRSPESIETHLNEEKSTIDFKADIWSIGCVMAELILGEPLFYQKTSINLKKQQKEGGFDRFNRKVYPIIARELKSICFIPSKIEKLFGEIGSYTQFLSLLKRCLEKDKEKRISVEEALNHKFFL